ncbi:DNA polymerase [Crossiella sp. SN42]|uniref:DNA polymerase n=1 Tax=Crossiella sp. SN42 TaxID=2944808 RepID=UPI00207CE1E2|nr:DNA polymerase [Crossiella sp. SN42]MCO1581683.1 DNA polymerase [Crossiella sp. SN42]
MHRIGLFAEKGDFAAMTASTPSDSPDRTDYQSLDNYLSALWNDWQSTSSPLPLGIEIIRRDNQTHIAITPLIPDKPVGGKTYVHESSTELLEELNLVRGARWISADLLAVATTLAESGVRLQSGLCLQLAERTLAVPASGATLAERYSVVCERVAGSEQRERLSTLLHLDSACALLAAEMNAGGVPWCSTTYRTVMADVLSSPMENDPYPRLAALDREIANEFGGARFNWRKELADAFDGEGILIPSSRLADLMDVEHPVVPLVQEWRKLDALASRHGYDWAEHWVRDGRWWPLFRPVGTPSGRWAGEGGALQLPLRLRPCVRVGPGRMLLCANLAQLEPRMWAHLSQDANLVEATARGDLYSSAADQLGVEREVAKRAVLAGIYGDYSPASRHTTRLLISRFPQAMQYLHRAVALGSNGMVVSTGLGRACPAADELVVAAQAIPWSERTPLQRKAVNRRSRQLRNFPVQGGAAELACAIAVGIRTALRDRDARLVMFCHDEFLIDAALGQIDEIEQSLPDIVRTAVKRVLGSSPVSWPLVIGRGRSWAEAGKQSAVG